MAQREGEDRPRHPSVTTLGRTGYRVLLSTSYSLWGGLLILFGSSTKFMLTAKRDDFIGLIATTATLAAIALAILAYLHESGSRDRYAKLTLAALTIMFLLATGTGLLAAMARDPRIDEPIPLHARFLVLGCVYVGGGISAPLASLLARLRLVTLTIVRRAADAYDYSIFGAVAATFVAWSPAAPFATVTVAATLGAMVLLLCSTTAMLATVWQVRSHAEVLEEQILQTLRSVRERHQIYGDAPNEVALSYLRGLLLSNDDTLLETIDALRRDDLVVEVGRQDYYILETSDWQKIANEIQVHDAALLSESLDSPCWEALLAFLEERTRLPRRTIRQYFGARIREDVERSFNMEVALAALTAKRDDPMLFVKPGAFERGAASIRSRIAEAVDKAGTNCGEERIGRLALDALFCLPPISDRDYWCSSVFKRVGKLVLEKQNGFLDETEVRRGVDLIAHADAMLVALGEQVFEAIALQLRAPYQIAEANFAAALRQHYFGKMVELPHPYHSAEYDQTFRVAVRRSSKERIRRVQTKQEGGPSLLLLPELPKEESAVFWAFVAEQLESV